MNFNRRTSHETSCCKIRSSLALRGSESQLFGCVHEMKDQLKTDPDFLSKIITGDESRSGDKATIKSMEKCIISETKKGEASQIKCENHVDLLL